MAFQLLRYILRIWEKHRRESSADLPQIIPLVLYHGAKTWNISHEFASLVESGKDADFANSTPNFEYFICDLSEFDEAEIKGEITLRVVLLLLKYIFSLELSFRLVEILRLLNDIPEKSVVELLARVIKYLSVSSNKISKTAVQTAMQTAFTTQEKQVDRWQEFLDEWKEEAEEKGLREGREKGLQQGLQQGKIDEATSLTLRLLKKRFGAVTSENEIVVRALTLEKIEQLSEDLLDFQKAEDLQIWLEFHAV